MSTVERTAQQHAKTPNTGKRPFWNYCQSNGLVWLAEFAGTLASRLDTRVTGGCCPVAEFGDVDAEERESMEEA